MGNKLNPSKTHSIIINLSRTPHSPLTLSGFDLEVSSSYELLGVTFDDKLTFDIKKLVLFANFTRLLAIMMQYSNPYMHLFLLCKKYCSSVWHSVSDSHLKLLDHTLNNMLLRAKPKNLAFLSMLYKILHNIDQRLHYKLPQFAKPILFTWNIAQQNNKSFLVAR